jgi:hypothetical protein
VSPQTTTFWLQQRDFGSRDRTTSTTMPGKRSTRDYSGARRHKETKATFKLSFSNQFQPLQELIEDSKTDIETQWKHSMKHMKRFWRRNRPNTRSRSLPIPSKNR